MEAPPKSNGERDILERAIAALLLVTGRPCLRSLR
jgi:hypothetical protein